MIIYESLDCNGRNIAVRDGERSGNSREIFKWCDISYLCSESKFDIFEKFYYYLISAQP